MCRNSTKVSLCLSFFLWLSVPAFAGNPMVGAGLYTKHCANCHGANGKAMLDGTPDLHISQLMSKTDEQLANTIKMGRSIMPGYQGLMSQEQIEDVVAYLRTFF